MLREIGFIHFSGIGGTAMAAVAVALKERGIRITGSDHQIYPPMSTFLAEHGVEVFPSYSEENLSDHPDLVVIGNALSRGNPEVEGVLERKLRYVSLPELLKEHFIRGKRSLVVTGTHGKTTTASLLAWVFDHNGCQPSYLIGGIPANLGRGARLTDSEWFVLEGDEYDTAFFDKRSKFVHYLPETAILNNVEFDHADIFENLAAVQKAFRQFIRLIPRNGLLLANGDDPNVAPLLSVDHCPIKRFGLGLGNDVRPTAIEYQASGTTFELGGERYRLNLPGEFNLRNALGVLACARHHGLSASRIQSAFDTFQGVKRRMEVRGVCAGVTVLDDFAHHPTAILETLKALRVKYPRERLWAVFEPRSNTTRRNIFQRELAEALAQADRAVVAAVARPEGLPAQDRLDPMRLIQEIQGRGREAVHVPEVDAIVDHLAEETRAGDVVCILSNGGFGGIHDRLLKRLGSKSSHANKMESTAVRP